MNSAAGRAARALERGRRVAARLAGPAFWLAAAALAWAALRLAAPRAGYNPFSFLTYADRGEAIFHGVLDGGIAFSMPLLSALVSLSSYHGLAGMELISKALLPAIYLLAYALGAAGGSRWRGLAFALPLVAMDAAGAGIETEQSVYTLLLFLYLNFARAHLLSPGGAAGALSGLALGLTLLVRPSLFLWPPLAAAWDFAGKAPLRKKLLAAGLLLAASFVLLLPWIRVNGRLFGKFVPFEYERGSCNIITAVKGTVYTMEGDCRALAGLSKTDSVPAWAVRTVLADPLFYAGNVAKRLWHVLLMFPLLLPLALIAVILRPRREHLFLGALAACFILTHCLLSIEHRYFYPLRYLLGIIAAGGLFDALFRPERGRAGVGALVYALAAAPALLAAVTEYSLLAYPGRAGNPLLSVERELKQYPEDPWLLKRRGFLLLGLNRTADGLADLARAADLAGGVEEHLRYSAEIVASEALPRRALPSEEGTLNEHDVLKLLKELELGRLGEAGVTFARARHFWASEKGSLKGLPYATDSRVLAEIQASTRSYANDDVYRGLFFWPPEKRERIIANFSRLSPLTPNLRYLLEESRLAQGKSPSAGVPAWLPGTGLDYARTKLDLTVEILKETPRVDGAGLPYPLPEILEAANLYLPGRPGEFLKALGGGRPGYRQLWPLLDLVKAKPGTRAFKAAAADLLEVSPGELPALVIRLSEGLGDKEVQAALRALQKNPEGAVKAAGTLADTGRKEKALGLCAWALKQPGAAAAALPAALLYQRLGEHHLALVALDAGLSRNKNSAELHNGRGVALRFLGRNAEAGPAFARALELAPALPEAAFNLASLRLLGGDKAGARDLFEKVLKQPGLDAGLAQRAELELTALRR